ncbi:MAG TPA: zinc ribbon domain-containing protein [Candidatus Binatus sp.]|nr:zinc ribbon domain-containing protein [Candidatus Binatus sp.]
MPIFEYNCRSCDHHFETIVLSNREKVSCPKCDSKTVDKQLSVFSAPGSSAKETAATAGAGCACTPQTCGCH